MCSLNNFSTNCMHIHDTSYLSELLHLYSLSRSLRSSADTRMLKFQRSDRKTHNFRTFSPFGHIWNNLPQDTRLHSATLFSYERNWRHFSCQNISASPSFVCWHARQKQQWSELQTQQGHDNSHSSSLSLLFCLENKKCSLDQICTLFLPRIPRTHSEHCFPASSSKLCRI